MGDLLRLLAGVLLRAKSLPVPERTVDAAIGQVKSGLLPIPNNDALWLAEIADSHQRPAPERVGLLSLGWFSGAHLTVYDRNGEEWYDVHPLVATDVRAQAERAGQRLACP